MREKVSGRRQGTTLEPMAQLRYSGRAGFQLRRKRDQINTALAAEAVNSRTSSGHDFLP
jgi:hypothetical protein